MESKPIYASKTIWVNLVAIVALVLNSLYGIQLDAETQATIATTILALVNVILRLVTTKPISR